MIPRSTCLEQKEGNIGGHLAGERLPLLGTNRRYHRRGFTARHVISVRRDPATFVYVLFYQARKNSRAILCIIAGGYLGLNSIIWRIRAGEYVITHGQIYSHFHSGLRVMYRCYVDGIFERNNPRHQQNFPTLLKH